jgi:hypothetical protein
LKRACSGFSNLVGQFMVDVNEVIEPAVPDEKIAIIGNRA